MLAYEQPPRLGYRLVFECHKSCNLAIQKPDIFLIPVSDDSGFWLSGVHIPTLIIRLNIANNVFNWVW